MMFEMESTVTGPVDELWRRYQELGRIGYQEVTFLMNTNHVGDMGMLWNDL